MSELGRRATLLAQHPTMAAPPVREVRDRASRYRHRRMRNVVTASAAFILAGGVVTWRLAAPAPFPPSGTLPAAAVAAIPAGPETGTAHGSPGTWQLAGYLSEPAAWSRGNAGPAAGGFLSCAADGTCYYAGTAGSGAADLYTSRDGGHTWTVIRMSGGASFTTPLTCPAAGDCLAGGEIGGHAVLLITSDGGIDWSYRALPPGDGALSSLTCSTDSACRALGAAPPPASGAYEQEGAWFLVTGDGGLRWTRHDFPAADMITGMACWTAADCVATGSAYRYDQATGIQPGVALRTTDGGGTWTSGRVPPKLSLNGGTGDYPDDVACAANGTCYALGQYPQRYHPAPPSGDSYSESCVNTPPANPAKPFRCIPPAYVPVSVVAVSTDGGATWRMLPLPARTPQPVLSAIACPSAGTCWVAGTEAVAQSVPAGNGHTAHNGGSAMILGTTNGGASWTKTTFAATRLVSGEQADALMMVGGIACPAVDSCVGVGAGDEGTAHVPVYTSGG